MNIEEICNSNYWYLSTVLCSVISKKPTIQIINYVRCLNIIRIVVVIFIFHRYEKHQREQENLQWYAAGDSRDCVCVDKNGNGLLRLWQQQLCQFNRVTMETVRAITAIYRSPCALLQVA